MRKHMKTPWLAWALLLLATLCINLLVPAKAPAESWKYKWGHFSAVAGEALSTGDVVCINNNGTVYKADADDTAMRPAVGLIGKGGSAGANVEIVTGGIISGIAQNLTYAAEHTNGSTWYLQPTPGVGNETDPKLGNQTQALGTVLPGGNDLLVNVQTPVP